MKCSEISAVLVTKGDSPSRIQTIVSSLPFLDVVIWDNSREPWDCKVYGRYLGIERAKHDVIFTQDDDCIVPAEDVAASYSDGEVHCNMPRDHSAAYAGKGIMLVGFGAIFHRRHVDFSQYFASWPCDELFERECDRVFTALSPCIEIDVGVMKLPEGDSPSRMWREQRHGDDFREISRRIAAVKPKAATA